MTLAEAMSLVGPVGATTTCTLPHDPLADQQALHQLAQWCEPFSPMVGCESASQPHSLLCDLSQVNLPALFGGLPAWKQQVEQAFGRRGLRPRVAVGGTMGAAWAVAHFAPADRWRATREMLLSLPLAALRLSEETIDTLAMLGITHVQQLALLPRATLHSRFGDEVLLRLDQALGDAAETFAALPPAPRWVYDWHFEHPTDMPAALSRAIEILLGRLATDLAPQQLGVLRLLCRFTANKQPLLVLTVGVYRATASVRHLLELVQLQLENQQLRAPVETITVAALETARLAVEQHALFDEAQRGSVRDLAALVDRLATRVGGENVVRPVRVANPQPEAAFRYVSLVATDKPRRRGKTVEPAPAPPNCDSPRPLTLEPPQPLTQVCAAMGGPPARFTWQGEEHLVVQAWGPERIETGWWRTNKKLASGGRKPPVSAGSMPNSHAKNSGLTPAARLEYGTRHTRRDYYRVETERGIHLWLFRERTTGRWFCHGSFD
jgi:protein ImuB